ncbi:30S ribosomal protein S8 [candidate division WWE3 bacterium RIFOXYC1_FULL_39_7]|uniref:Small ribosomal subunit protein uS8 n=2 Tax=Katanobacteria TaxID=422282 RepID=A0A1F4X455_UNCKA|nr:MAG: 30S ribosomal protein S8 [candidate division WWE3 bacterium RIFOXYC1_FULL_39_7]OGC76482.1 MAG: 30S ribosomal protein S8 [candidate division WWE3 bacterium RIFOXYD1_FULL_39_9]
MSIDRLANMLSTLKNASMAKKPVVEMVYSRECEAVAQVLKDKGFLRTVKTFKPSEQPFKMLHIELEHDEDGTYAITDVKRVSKPGSRVYKGVSEIHRVAGGFGTLVVSTSRGIFSGDEAKKRKLGGEVICEVK